jgi:hypothetical protein
MPPEATDELGFRAGGNVAKDVTKHLFYNYNLLVDKSPAQC